MSGNEAMTELETVLRDKKEPIILLPRTILLLFFGVVGLFSVHQYPSCTNLMTVNVRSLKRCSDSSSILAKVFIYIR